MIFFIELRLHEESDNLALPLIFFQFASVKYLKIFLIFEICTADHLKAEIN